MEEIDEATGADHRQQEKTKDENAPRTHQAYVDVHLLGTKMCSEALILGASGDHEGYAFTDNLHRLTEPEALELIRGFDNPELIKKTGWTIGGRFYKTLKADARSIYGYDEKEGYCAVKTNSHVFLGLYDATIQRGQCANQVEKLADYFLEFDL